MTTNQTFQAYDQACNEDAERYAAEKAQREEAAYNARKAAKPAATKVADIRYRVELKNNPWIVVYKVASSDGTQVYDVTVCHGKVNNCTCISHKPCYHMRGVQGREDARTLERDVERTAYNNFCLAMGI